MNTQTDLSGFIERTIRNNLIGLPGGMVQEAVGWDSASVSRFLSGQQGVPLAKIEALLDAVDCVVVSREYLGALSAMSRVGANCRCALAGGGECGPGRSKGENRAAFMTCGGRA